MFLLATIIRTGQNKASNPLFCIIYHYRRLLSKAFWTVYLFDFMSFFAWTYFFPIRQLFHAIFFKFLLSKFLFYFFSELLNLNTPQSPECSEELLWLPEYLPESDFLTWCPLLCHTLPCLLMPLIGGPVITINYLILHSALKKI